MADDAPIDTIKPWSIKACATRTQAIVAAAARRDNLTVGQWLEKRVDEWEAQGRPERLAQPIEVRPSITELTALLTAAGAMSQHARLPRDVRSLIGIVARALAEVLPRQIPRHTKVPPPRRIALIQPPDAAD